MTARSADSLRFRFATAEDVASIVALVERAYRADDGGWTTEAHLISGRRTGADEVQDLVASASGGLLTLADRGEIVATCQLDRRDDHAYFGMFAVDPRRQARGLGRALLAEAERIARDEWRCARMRMTVISARGDLIAWYERRGYRRTGVASPFPYGDARFGEPRVEGLRFDEFEKPLG